MEEWSFSIRTILTIYNFITAWKHHVGIDSSCLCCKFFQISASNLLTTGCYTLDTNRSHNQATFLLYKRKPHRNSNKNQTKTHPTPLTKPNLSMGQEAGWKREAKLKPCYFSSLKICLLSKKKLPKKQRLSQKHDLSAISFTSTSMQITHS